MIDAGEYTVNPTSLAAEPVTGCNLTGATLTLTQGVSIAGIVTPGIYSVKPANPAATTTGGSGTGATLTIQYNAGGTYAVGTDNTTAISAAIAQSNSLYAIGTHTCVYFPSRDSRSPGGVGYLVVSSPTQFSKGNPGCILGDGGDRSVVRMGSTFTGNLFSWDDAWYENDHPLLGTTPMSSVKNGPLARGIGVVGDTASAGQQTAFEFLDIVSHILFDDVTCKYVHGYCIVGGINHPFEGNYGPGESRFYNVRVESSGSDTVPAMLMTAGGAGDSSNQIEFFGLEFLRCYGKCMVLDSGTSTPPFGGLKGYRFYSPRFERSLVGDDLVVIGDPVHTGITSGITMTGFTGNHSDADHAIVRITAPGSSNQPFDINIERVV